MLCVALRWPRPPPPARKDKEQDSVLLLLDHLAICKAAANGRHCGPTMRCERSRTDRRTLGAFRYHTGFSLSEERPKNALRDHPEFAAEPFSVLQNPWTSSARQAQDRGTATKVLGGRTLLPTPIFRSNPGRMCMLQHHRCGSDVTLRMSIFACDCKLSS